MDRLISEYPERAFLALFRVQRQAFWRLIPRVKDYWETADERIGGGRYSRPIYQQVAVGHSDCAVLKKAFEEKKNAAGSAEIA